MSLAEIELILRQNIGLDAASVGITTVERAVRQRMKTSGRATTEAYLEYLRGSTAEFQELVESIVVSETWFFRDEEAFGTLVRLITEELIPSRVAPDLRILSVPCSTGEEPYSMVMALRDAGVPSNQLRVDAVDISTRALNHARKGVYGNHSFRSRSLAFRERHFRPTKDGYAVHDWISRAVKLHQGNLVSGQFPFAAVPYDVILCRNLLIYFDRPTQERVMQILSTLLAPSGILFVGHAEAFLAVSQGFVAVSTAAPFAFRKGPGPQVRSIEAVLPKLQTKIRDLSIAALPPLTDPLLASKADDSEPTDLATAQHWADQGNLQKAAECCERHIANHRPSAEALYLLGVVRSAAGENKRAADCYRQALYLDPQHQEALTHLAILHEREGDGAAARRFRERARRANPSTERKRVATP